jgi:hypothetical protein
MNLKQNHVNLIRLPSTFTRRAEVSRREIFLPFARDGYHANPARSVDCRDRRNPGAIAVAGLDAAQLDAPYRPGGWTVRQVVHHVPESHMNAYIRFKLGLTEDEPTIKPYDEDAWAKLPDVAVTPVETSLALLDELHLRWVTLLRLLDDAQFARTFRHPALGVIRLDGNLALYAWHGKHHTAHITSLRERMGWR